MSWRKLHGRYDLYTARRARSLLREILSPTRVKLSELIGRSCETAAQGNAHTLAEDIRMSSLESLFLDDLEKHVQMNRARLHSYNLLREEIKTYCEYRGHASVRTRQKGPSHAGGDDPMDIGAFGKGKVKQSKGKQGQQGQGRQGRDKSKDSRKLRKARTSLERLLERE